MSATWSRSLLACTAIGLLAACAEEARQTSTSQASQGGDVECVPIEEGALYRVVDGRLTAASAPDPVIIERVIEPEMNWAERVEARFPDIGFPWLQLDARNAGSGVVTLTGLAPSTEAKNEALAAGEEAIKSVPQGRDILVIDGISVEGGEEGVGAALGDLDDNASVETCQNAFSRVMNGRNVSFGTGGASISGQSARLLDAATGVAILCSEYEIEVRGHTDSVGDALYNQRLSERRANAVRQYLIDKGVPAGSLEAVGYGESEPLDDRDAPEAHARNRRTEFVVREAR